MREPAPPYRGEGPHALWHVSENPSLATFEPHISATAGSDEPRVWAVDTRHLPLYWFPRDCPRAAFWATDHTTPEDLGLLAGAARVHAAEGAWLGHVRDARVFAYRLPTAAFEQGFQVGGYWLSREAVVPLEVVALHDLLELHSRAGIELRLTENLWPLWDRVVASTLEFSGIQLHNARPPAS